MDFDTPRPLENQYWLSITPNEAAAGIAATLKNAKELLEDAGILLQRKRYPRTIALSILAIEEFGKVEKIKELLLSKGMISKIWKQVRSHKAKNYFWLFPILKQMGPIDTATIQSLTASDSKPAQFLDELKQICFYTEAVKAGKKGDCEWWLPSVITDDKLAEFYYHLAAQVVLDDGIQWTEKALEIFVQYNYYDDGNVITRDQIGFYMALRDSNLITEERLSKIINNINSQQREDTKKKNDQM